MSKGKKNSERIVKIALATSAVNLIISIIELIRQLTS